jgi:hypothetical protein
MESPVDCPAVDLPRNCSVLAFDGALLVKLIPTTETANDDLTRNAEICLMDQVGFRAAVGIWLSNRFRRFAVRVQSWSESLILAPRWTFYRLHQTFRERSRVEGSFME